MIHETNVFVIYEGDGENKTFGWPYPYTDENSLTPYLLKDGVKTEITNNFTFDKVSQVLTYPVDGDPIQAGEKLLVARKTEISQLMDLPEYFPFKIEEKAHDKSIMIAQEHDEAIARSLKVEMGQDVNPMLPTPKPNEGFAWDEEGKKLVPIPNLRIATVGAMESATVAIEAAQRADHIRKQTEDIANAAEANIQNLKVDALTSIDGAKTNALHEVEISTEIAKEWALEAEASKDDAKLSETNAKSSETEAKIAEDEAKKAAQGIGDPISKVERNGENLDFTKASGSSSSIQINNFDVIQLKDTSTGELTFIYAKDGGLFYSDTDPNMEG